MADLQRKTYNLFDGVIEQGIWDATKSPIAKEDSQTRCRTSDFIDVTENAEYAISLNNAGSNIQYVIHFLNGSKGKISEVGWSTAPISFTTPNGCQYIDLIFKNTAGTAISPVNCGLLMVNEGSTPRSYEPYGWQHSLRKLTTATEAVENPLYSDGSPITAYTLKGNTVQNGTPTPSNPVDVNGVGVRTENLFNERIEGAIITSGGVIESNAVYDVAVIPVIAGEQYTFAYKQDYVQNYVIAYYTTKPVIGSTSYDGSRIVYYYSDTPQVTITVPNGVTYIAIRLPLNGDLMLNTGSTAKPYEPYGYKIPISNGQQTTNVYLGSTQTTRQIKKIVFDGTENWQGAYNSASKYLADILDYKLGSEITCMSTHYSGANNIVSGDSIPNNSACFYNANSPRLLYLKGSEPITVADFKAYLAQQYANGTPVTVWYVLAAVTTGQVNEPLMKIGTYADTLSNATAIPTTDGANTITVDTTVQPSEFTATWTGWHNASVKEKSANLFDYQTMKVGKTGYYLDASGNEIQNTGYWSITKYIPVDGTTFTLTRTFAGNAPAICLYDSNQNYITGVSYQGEQVVTISSNTNAAYIRFSYFIGEPLEDVAHDMLNTGETALPYEPYWK